MPSNASLPTNDCVQVELNYAAMQISSNALAHTTDALDLDTGTRQSPNTMDIHNRIESTWLQLDGVSSSFQPYSHGDTRSVAEHPQRIGQGLGMYHGTLYASQPASESRPKTSRGLSERQESSSALGTEGNRNFGITGRLNLGEHHSRAGTYSARHPELAPRQSAFYEHTARRKAEAAAATTSTTRSDSNEDMTPARVPGRVSAEETTPRRSSESSLDIQEFNPLPPTPSTLRATLGRISRRFRPVTEEIPSDGTSRPVLTESETETRRSKGLRKSISSWTIRSLPRKSKSSNNLRTDLRKAPVSIRHDRSAIDLVEAMVSEMIQTGPLSETPQGDGAFLDERKRKAETTHTDQSQLNKRQKASSSLAQESHVHSTLAASSRTDKAVDTRSTRRRSGPEIYTSSPLSRPELNSSIVWRTPSAKSAPTSPLSVVSEATSSLSSYETDYRKRPSRRELEKENQVLRALLREAQQSRPAETDVPRPLPQLPLGGRPTLSPALSTGWMQQITPRYTLRPSTRNGVPPVPCIPAKAPSDRKTSKLPLQVIKPPNWTSSEDPVIEEEHVDIMLSSTQSSPTRRRLRKKRPAQIDELPRPLSVVFEGVEEDSHVLDYAYEAQVENVRPANSEQERSPCRPSFDWDKDTF